MKNKDPFSLKKDKKYKNDLFYNIFIIKNIKWELTIYINF